MEWRGYYPWRVYSISSILTIFGLLMVILGFYYAVDPIVLSGTLLMMFSLATLLLVWRYSSIYRSNFIKTFLTEKELSEIVHRAVKCIGGATFKRIWISRIEFRFGLFETFVYHPRRGILKVDHVSTGMKSIVDGIVKMKRVDIRDEKGTFSVRTFKEMVEDVNVRPKKNLKNLKGFKRNLFDLFLDAILIGVFVLPAMISFQIINELAVQVIIVLSKLVLCELF